MRIDTNAQLIKTLCFIFFKNYQHYMAILICRLSV